MALAIEIRNLTKVYRTAQRTQITALAGVDLQVQPGEVFGFIGPNGAGKTSCIKILAGLSWPSGGEARIFEEKAGTVAARRTLGYLPEIASYHGFMTATELLLQHAALAGIQSADRAAACKEALAAVALEDRAHSRVGELSKGMQQRFGIAQALVGRPRVLIFDEVTSGLDPLAQKEVKDTIVQLKGRGITIFFSSHKLTEVEHICDTIGILHRGKLLRCCPLADMVAPSHRVEIRFRGPQPSTPRSWQDGRLAVEPRDSDAALDEIRAAGGTVLSLGEERMSLEDAFFQLIRGSEA